LRRLVDALGGLDVHAVVTVGPGMRARPLPAPAPNVVLTEFVPHGSVLEHVDLVITHGGHGTVVRSLAAGVPVLVVPISRDQPDNAARVVHHGVGAKVSQRSSVDTFRRAIERLLHDATVKRRTLALADRLKPDMGAPTAVAALTELVSSRKEVS
jgi:UDP:flavonoid glycosyltransferase YjiC (YdhE family)